jgi:hypothetical protein
MLAYEHNLATIKKEASFGTLEPYRHVLAALLLMNQDMQNALKAVGGLGLANSYTIVTGADEDNFLPAFGTGEGTYVPDPMLVFTEVYIGPADADFDGTTNKQEYDNITSIGGDLIDFAVNAYRRNLDGTGVGVGSSNCFIATAAFGTPLAPEIDRLRMFRDSHLLTNSLGTAFTDVYYHVSPPVADFIAKRPSLRAGVRGGIYAGLWSMDHPYLALCLTLSAFGAGVFWIGKRTRARVASRGSGGV